MLNKPKFTLTILLILITFGFYGIMLVWFPKLRKISLYKEMDIN